MSEKVYWCGHHTFGDAFCLCAAAYLISLESGVQIKVSYRSIFKELVNYFNNIQYVEENELSNYIKIDCGINPGENIYNFNGITRCLRFMTDNKQTLCYNKNLLNISPYLNNNTISICADGNVNGQISTQIFKKMLERSKYFYPNCDIQFIGHFNKDISLYDSLISEYHIKDNRTRDTTVNTIMEQLRRSSLIMGVHTGPLFPALLMGIPVWCENSKDLSHNYLLDFPNNKPFFFV